MTAILKYRDRTFFARAGTQLLSTPITALIRGIYGAEPTLARAILRSRILSDQEPSEMDWGTVKVAAKRLSVEKIAIPPDAIEVSEPSFPTPLPTPAMDGHPLQAAIELRNQSRLSETKHLSDRRVGAILISASGNALGWGINRSSLHRCFHAEIEAIFHAGGRVPAGATLYTTRKCCKMCAGTFWTAAENIRTNRIEFLEDDPGPMAKLTVFTPDSFERKRATSSWKSDRDFVLELQSQGIPGSTVRQTF